MATRNGYTSEATESLLLFLKNDLNQYLFLRDWAKIAQSRVTNEESTREEECKRVVKIYKDYLQSTYSMYEGLTGTLLQIGLNSINWEEIAEDLID